MVTAAEASKCSSAIEPSHQRGVAAEAGRYTGKANSGNENLGALACISRRLGVLARLSGRLDAPM